MSAGTPRASVLLSTYRNPRALRLALEGYARQSERAFEVVVCDDGSGPETAEAVRAAGRELDLEVRHVRQEDRGNRKGRALNEGAARSRGSVLVFSDQDCVPHRRFVEEHVRSSAPRTIGHGRVVRLGDALSGKVTCQDVRSGRLEAGLTRLLWWSLCGRARAVEAGLYLGRVPLLRNMGAGFHQLFGGNFSCPRETFEEVNGFDERLEGWGREDTELGWRFRHAGCAFRNLKFRAILYHLWHPPQPRDRLPLNDRFLEETIRTGRVRCDDGLDRHRRDGRRAG